MVENMADDPIEGSDIHADPDMETIILDGETVTVPKEYAEQLKRIETTMKSGLNKKHEERQRDLAAKIKTDKDWLNQHADRPELWAQYEPTVDGGRGFIGSNDMLNEPSKTEPKVEVNTEIATMKQEIADLKEKVSGVASDTNQNLIDQAARARGAALSKYSYANKDDLTIKMEHYYLLNKIHPSQEIIEGFAKADHDRIVKIKGITPVTTMTTTTDTTTLPKPSNAPPTGTKPKLPRVDDTQGVVKLIEGLNLKF